MINYTNLCDEELVVLAQNGDVFAEECLIRRHEILVYQLSKNYYSKGTEREDFLQMGLIGLCKAIRTYNCNQEHYPVAKFRSFSTLCIKSELATYLKFCTRQKHEVLNNAIPSLSFCTNNIEDNKFNHNSFLDLVMKDTTNDPQNIMLAKERQKSFEFIINGALTTLEREVLTLWVNDYSYKEISLIIERNVKSVENSIQRIRKKLKREFSKLSA